MKTLRIPILERALAEVLRMADRPEIVDFSMMQMYKIIMKQQETIEELRRER